jgi:hypothetical protein
MNREVGRFLLETWQMFYWSFFFPSKLQQRMNEWSPQKTKKGIPRDTSNFDILLVEPNSRFIFQCCFILVIFSLPLIGMNAFSKGGWSWLILLIGPSISYGLGLLYFLPSGITFCSPLLSALIYWQQSDRLEKTLTFVVSVLVKLLPQLLVGLGISIVALFLNFLLVVILLKQNFLFFSRLVFWIGSGLSVALASWLVTHDWSIALILLLSISIAMLFFSNQINLDSNITRLAIRVAVVVPISIFIFAAYGSLQVASAIIVMLVFTPLFWFLSICIFVSFSLAPLKRKWLPGWISLFFLLLGYKLGLNAFWAIPVSLLGYYRIFPDYLLTLSTYLASFVFTQTKLMRRLSPNPASLLNKFPPLNKLPPYTTELLWFSIPNHEHILSDTFCQNTTLGLATFQKMQAISLPGFQSTLKNALPIIVAEQFAAVSTTTELVDSVTPIYPLLPLLIPAFYQSDENTQFSKSLKSGDSEIDLLFPLLQDNARNTKSALQASSSALRERGLERLVDKLKMLSAQLPGLGLNSQAVKRWQPVIERWQRILELEIAEQQKTSQGELLNPFQFGNPLRPDRDNLFKGRQDFADRLVRLILDQTRPTLVLHGPRRIGKTSFLLNLPRLLPSDLVPIYLDMQQGSMTASEGDFCYGLVRAIDRDTRSQGLQLPPIPSRIDFFSKTYPTLEDWLDLALPKLGERRLLLNLDEFEKIGSAIKDGRISDRLFDQLRSMIQHYDRLGFLFSGVQTLEELGPRWSNYFISVVPMEMHYLEPHEAEDLLLHPDPEFTLQYDTGILAKILRLTRCQPYLLQLIGSAIVNQANIQQTKLATTALLQAAIQSAFTNGEPYFTNIWTEFTGNKDNPAEVTAGQQILIALAQGNPHVETSDEATAARRRLLRYRVIEWDGDINKIEIPLFEQWVRERAIHQR